MIDVTVKTEMVLGVFTEIAQVLKKYKIDPKDIDQIGDLLESLMEVK